MFDSLFHEDFVDFRGIVLIKQRNGTATRCQVRWHLAEEEQEDDADQHGRQPRLILTDTKLMKRNANHQARHGDLRYFYH